MQDESKAAVVSGWQSISTAPRDGTRVLLREKWLDYPFVGFWNGRHWSAEKDHLGVEAGWGGGIVIDDFTQADITHWQPLPPPPAKDGAP